MSGFRIISKELKPLGSFNGMVGVCCPSFMHAPMPFEAAAQMERDLAEDLRHQGYTVTGGH